MRSLAVLVTSLFVVVVLGWLAGRAAPRPITDLVEAVNGGDAAAAARMLDDPLRWFTWPTAAWGRPLATKSAVSDVFAFHAATGGNVEVVECRREKQPSVKGLDETHRCSFTAHSELLALIGAEPTSGEIVAGLDDGLIKWFDVIYFDGPPITWAFDSWMFHHTNAQTLAAWATSYTSMRTAPPDSDTVGLFTFTPEIGAFPEDDHVGDDVFFATGRPTYTAATGQLLLELADRYASEAVPLLEGIDVELKIAWCLEDRMEGTVTNRSSQTIDVAVFARFTDGGGIKQRVSTVARLDPGETERWGAADLGLLAWRCEHPTVVIAVDGGPELLTGHARYD